MAIENETAQDTPLTLKTLLTPEVHDNPYPFYHRLLDESPIHWDEAAGIEGGWVLSRQADVAAALKDSRFSAVRLLAESTEWVPDEMLDAARQVFRAMPHQLLFLDPPDHTRIRGLMSRAFTPRLVEALRPRMQAIADELLDAVVDSGHMEVINDFSYPLPAIVIAELLGVPPEDRAQFTKWSSDFGGFLDSSNLSFEQVLAALQGVSDFMDYFRALIAVRRTQPRDDLLQAMIVAREQNDKLSEDELLANLVLVLAAGHGTTTHLIGNGLLALLGHPDQLRALAQDPSLIATGVPELLRYDSPVQLTGRRATADLEIGGQPIKAGQHVTVVLGAANRDPAAFPDPDRLDVARPEGRILSFGQGVHFCLGAPLARIEAGIALNAALRRLPNLCLDADPATLTWEPSIVFRGLNALPVAFG
jgi:cytochrome P450